MTLDDNIMMFVSNIRELFLKKLNPLRVLFPCHNTNDYGNTVITPALTDRQVAVGTGPSPLHSVSTLPGVWCASSVVRGYEEAEKKAERARKR